MKKILICLIVIALAVQSASGQLASIVGWVVFPPLPVGLVTTAAFGNTTIDASGEMAGHCFFAPATGNIDQVGVRVGAVTVADDLVVSLQNVDTTTGFPDEVADQSATIAAGTLVANSFFTAALDVARAVTIGEFLCVVAGVTFVDANLGISNFADHVQLSGYGAVKVAGAWAKSTNPGVFAIRYDSTVWVPINGVWPIETLTTTTYADATNPDERGNSLTLPFKARAVGFCGWYINNDSDYTVNLFDAADMSLASATMDGDVASATNVHGVQCGYFTAAVELAAATQYRLAIRVTAGGGLGLNEFSVDSAAIMGALVGGPNIFLTTRNNGAGAWTDTATSRAFLGLLLDQLVAGAGGGGGSLGRGIIGQ